MKQWTVAYRGKTGARETLVLEAESRTDLFAQLERRGISALHVEEGATGRKSGATGRKSGATGRVGASAAFKGLLAAVLVVIGAVAAFLVLTTRRPAGPQESKERPAKAPVAEAVPPAPAEPPKTDAPANTEAARADVPPSNIYTNRQGQEVHVEKDGTKTIISSAWARRLKAEQENPPKRLFRHTSEGYLAMFLNPAVSVPPPPENYTDEQVLAMLTNKIEIEDDDTEDERRQKEGVERMKAELRQWIRDGGTFNTYLAELQHRQELEAAQMFDARNMITESIESGDIEEARALYDKINEHFARQFMPKVNVAPKYRRLLEER